MTEIKQDDPDTKLDRTFNTLLIKMPESARF